MTEGFDLQGLSYGDVNDGYEGREKCVNSLLGTFLRQSFSILAHVKELALDVWRNLVGLAQVTRE